MTQVETAPTVPEVGLKLAKYITAIADKAIAARGKFTVAVSGGSLPKTLGSGLLHMNEESKIDFSKWQFLYADERSVPLDHADSNHLECKTQIYDPLSISCADNVHAIDYSEDVEEVAAKYEKTLASVFGACDAPQPPVFDLVLLGMGPDGHTLSLFPGHALLEERTKLVASLADSPKPPSKRVTLTYPVCEAARNVAFVTSGAAKADVVYNIHKEGNSNNYPSGLVKCANEDGVMWFLDATAAGKL
ncbi:6-phosphogluconolactonase [Sphaeroforma arctica JP610]|uniref:6-phosphogluconolactonase n=1 Tax=Sphaeroforma arctica JP610 TaxID=667725 RepID=A0A0L0FFC6_9EUKA|nr:6-phosphogluconolactonase [Sphaeroforma arctica JP610]KNC75482.1 6-phosphogluconolactonase [Sphaeroforma arctica JP610]|eukprot:XP_014149384.1 6-phosphogluconolactonase [Sphaeroforma arctica JP610]